LLNGYVDAVLPKRWRCVRVSCWPVPSPTPEVTP
jgi:hypothetical protein